ncbi:MAG: xanthine dehydrogenase family protein molybdopterin-binding subunit [Caldisericaceae bacterium]|nr:xanthine dehydrogenase family protein molybdopterin-binding subunit [Caldisericaceae bacterium]
MEYKYIGKDAKRPSAVERITGKAIFVDDIRLPGMLYAKILYPKYAHAKILSIDTSEAEKMPGVVKVVTGKNIKHPFGDCLHDRLPMAVDKVRYIGEPVAAVIADTERHARAALSKIKVEYEPLPVYTDALDAMKKDAVLIHEHSEKYFYVTPLYKPTPGTNIAITYEIKKGDVKKGFKEADVVVEDEFNFHHMSSVAIEPHATIALHHLDGTVEIWTANVGPFAVREQVAEFFGKNISDVRVHIPHIGGCFGYKSDPGIEPLVAYIASFVPGRPVKLRLTRKEDFTSTFIGRGIRARVKVGATKDGKLTALEETLYLSTGAYADTGSNILIVAVQTSGGVYYFPNAHVKGYSVYTNTPPVGALRAYGHPEAEFAIERIMDMLARKLDMSPIELRKKNYITDGKTNVVGEKFKKSDGDLFKCTESVLEAIPPKVEVKEDENYLYGVGYAGLIKAPKAATFASKGCHIKFNVDGTVSLNMAGGDVGQGLWTVARQIAAEALKMPPEKIKVYNEIDTQYSPWEWQTVGSMFTFQGGNAIIRAANKAIDALKRNASLVLKRDPDMLEYDGEYVYDRSYPDVKVAVKDICRGYVTEDGTTIGEVVDVTSYFRLPGVQGPDPETGMGRTGGSYTMGFQGCKVKIDKRTGKVYIDHFATSIDVGKVIFPKGAEAQVLGGVLMGIGETLMEEVRFKENGEIANPDLIRYKLPRIEDLPGKQTVKFIETPDAVGPFGARGLGEHPMIGVAPAILNAIYDAIGYDFKEVPVTQDMVKKVLEEKGLTVKDKEE